MTKMDGRTPDIAEENIEKLKQLFPEICCEDKVDFDKLKQVLGDYVDDDTERYNFTWNGKGRALKLSQTPSTGTLRPCKEESKNWEDTENLYIEGDNLEVLKLLQKSYYGKVKMIYIDPPYNTGNDFVYKDSFKDGIDNYKKITGQIDSNAKNVGTNSETSGRYHTEWLNTMYPRLRLARNLLAEDGVVFISIDDNEIENIRKVSDEIYGESNFVAQLTIIVKTEGRQYGFFAKTHEYILVYAKSSISLNLNKIDTPNAEFRYYDDKGGFNTIGLRNRAVRIFNSTNRPNLRYPFYVNDFQKDEYEFSEVSTIRHENWIEVWPSVVDGIESVWRWGKDTAEANKGELVACRGNDNQIRVFKKDRDLTTLPKTVWFDKNFNSIVGTREVAKLVGKGFFSFPKPLSLLKQITQIATDNNSIVLDFFSGSATTAHAVMQLNAEDGGNRKFIMIQLPEKTEEETEAYKEGYKNICDIGKERIRRAGEKIKTEIEDANNQIKIDGDAKEVPDIGFKVFKLDSSNIKKWQPDDEKVEDTLISSMDNFMPERTEKDVIYEIMIKLGLDLSYPVDVKEVAGRKIYFIGIGSLMVCLDDDITIEVAETMIKLHNVLQPEIWKVVFKDNGFKDDSTKINILEVFKSAGLEEDAFTTI